MSYSTPTAIPACGSKSTGAAVTVAVEDSSHPRRVCEEATDGRTRVPSGLRIVAAMCRTWGNTPTPTGKTVWAVIGPENRL